MRMGGVAKGGLERPQGGPGVGAGGRHQIRPPRRGRRRFSRRTVVRTDFFEVGADDFADVFRVWLGTRRQVILAEAQAGTMVYCPRPDQPLVRPLISRVGRALRCSVAGEAAFPKQFRHAQQFFEGGVLRG